MQIPKKDQLKTNVNLPNGALSLTRTFSGSRLETCSNVVKQSSCC